jgi:DNA-binding NtrC family response regulator
MSKNVIRVMLIEDEEFDVRRIRRTVEPFADRIKIVDVFANGRLAVDQLEKSPHAYDVVIMDFQIAGGLMGEPLIRRIKEIDPALQIIVVTKMTINMTDYEFASRLLEAGATWYCTKYPADIDDFIYQPTDFILSIFNAYEKKRLELERRRSAARLEKSIEDILARKVIVGQSPAIQRLREQIQQCAATDTTVLIRGASGTGKELVATHIHYLSRRRLENFVPINCGSLPENLIESELFGYEKGAFTGADTSKPGLFELADRGTVFLDEITELPPNTQSTLLRVIQEGEIDKIGRTRRVKVDVRVIAATNRDLEREVNEGRFREDLYYRLNVLSIYVPPLAERREDIPLLVEHYFKRYSDDMGRTPPELSPAAWEVLLNYSWPGNVRQLQNVIQRLLLTGRGQLDREDVEAALGFQLRLRKEGDMEDWLKRWGDGKILPWREMEREFRKEYFRYVRKIASSDAEAARMLGLAPPNFHRMCRELGLK